MITESYGLPLKYVMLRSGASIPYMEIPKFSGVRLVTLPFCDYTDLHTGNMAQVHEVFQALRQLQPEAEIVLKCQGREADFNPSLEISRRAVYHRIPLQDQISYSDSFKRGVRKAQKAGISVTATYDRAALVRFYNLYTELRKAKFNSIPQPFVFFDQIEKHFLATGKGIVLEACIEDCTVASAIVLFHGPRWYYKFGASHTAYLDQRPNNLLFDTMIQKAREAGATELDLGLSGISSSYAGLRRFKSAMGGVENPLLYLTYRPASFPDDARQQHFMRSVTQALVQGDASPNFMSTLSKTVYPYFG